MVSDPVKKIGLGSRTLNYQSDDTVDSLVIPPDLTKPSSQGLFVENIGVMIKVIRLAKFRMLK